MTVVDESFTFADFMRERHAELPLFLIRLAPLPGHGPEAYVTAAGRELLRQHFLYWWRLEEAGRLIGAGPVDVGTAGQTGLAIVRAASLAEADAIAAAEPLHRAGWRSNTVSSWRLNEGAAVALVRAMPPVADVQVPNAPG